MHFTLQSTLSIQWQAYRPKRERRRWKGVSMRRRQDREIAADIGPQQLLANERAVH